jgi:hypothetical protein
MKKTKTEYTELFLHGYKFHIYPDTIKVFNFENIPIEDFKAGVNSKIKYLMDEAFIERKKINIDIVIPE